MPSVMPRLQLGSVRLGWSTVAGGISVALRVLIVDDEPDIRQVLRLVLEKDGCEVIGRERRG